MPRSEDSRWRYVYYKSPSGEVPVRKFIEERDDDTKAKIREDLRRLVKFNVKLGPPYCEKVAGRGFWELRTSWSGDIYRTFYFLYTGRKFVLLHAIKKKSRKAPEKELDTAEDRMKNYLRLKEKRG